MVIAAQDVADAIDVLTAKAQSCQGPANQINMVNIALAVSGFGPIPVVIVRLLDMITTCGTTITQLSGTQPFTTKSDEDLIVKAVKTFVQVHQALLNILIGKAGLVPNLLPFVGPYAFPKSNGSVSPPDSVYRPLAQALRQLESVYDTLLFELLDLCPDNATDLKSQMDSLDGTLATSIDGWSGGIKIAAST